MSEIKLDRAGKIIGFLKSQENKRATLEDICNNTELPEEYVLSTIEKDLCGGVYFAGISEEGKKIYGL
jgi:hypothetical protein